MYTPRWTVPARAQYDEPKDAADRAFKHRRGKGKSTDAEGLFKQVHGCVTKLLHNPRHPGLKTHKYLSLPHPWKKGEPVFEAYAQNDTPGAYRVFWCYGPGRGEVTIIAITPHP